MPSSREGAARPAAPRDSSDFLGGFFRRMNLSFGLGSEPAEKQPPSGGGSFATNAEAMMSGASTSNSAAVAAAHLPPGMPKGLYLWGGVGSGKTMLMESFLECLPPAVKGRRAHFHRFMLDLHEELHMERQRNLQAGSRAGDPLPKIAARLAADADVLCLDELMVTDIGDAMLLGRLVPALIQAGCVLVTTSNRPPVDLYKNGLSRELFVPCIVLLQAALEECRLDAGVDYRMAGEQAGRTWLTRGAGEPGPGTATSANPDSPEEPEASGALAGFDESWRRATRECQEEAVVLRAQGREVRCGRAVRRAPAPFAAARFRFDELCGDGDGARAGGPMGTADFRAIAGAFGAVFVDGVPVLSANRRNELRRFITLVDTLYDEGRALVVEAEAPLHEMLSDADPQQGGHQPDEVFAFDRTRSRLVEMGSEAYLAEAQAKAAGTLVT